jgi:enhancing lycopene biosynthesis protein 2
VDEKLKIVSTPAFMLAERAIEAEPGIKKLVAKVLELIG